nr:MAG TPA: hypothetical protein [Caudoviricetes sp.]
MYFSVKRAVRIAGKNYFPCICYPLTDFLKSTIERLEKEGKAKVYDHFVFFQNGKIINDRPETAEIRAEEPEIRAEEPEIRAEMPLKEQEETVKKSKKPHKKAEKSTEKDETEGF